MKVPTLIVPSIVGEKTLATGKLTRFNA